MSSFIVLAAARVHEHHQSDTNCKGDRHASNQSTNAMAAQSFETAQKEGSAKNQKRQDDNIDHCPQEN